MKISEAKRISTIYLGVDGTKTYMVRVSLVARVADVLVNVVKLEESPTAALRKTSGGEQLPENYREREKKGCCSFIQSKR